MRVFFDKKYAGVIIYTDVLLNTMGTTMVHKFALSLLATVFMVFSSPVFAGTVLSEEAFQAELPGDYASWSRYKGMCKISGKNDVLDTIQVFSYVNDNKEMSEMGGVAIFVLNEQHIFTSYVYVNGRGAGDVLKMYYQNVDDEKGSVFKRDSSDKFDEDAIARAQVTLGTLLSENCPEVFRGLTEVPTGQ